MARGLLRLRRFFLGEAALAHFFELAGLTSRVPEMPLGQQRSNIIQIHGPDLRPALRVVP